MTAIALPTDTDTRPLATVTPIRARVNLAARAEALENLAWDLSLDPRDADGNVHLNPADTATLTGLLPHLPLPTARDHFEQLVDCCDQARQAGAGDSDRQSQADRDDEAEATDRLHTAAATAIRADLAAGAA